MKKTQASRCWERREAKVQRDLFEDPDIRRWYDNLSRGSKITADVYLRRLGSICRSRGIKNPKELSALAGLTTVEECGRSYFIMGPGDKAGRASEGKAGSGIDSEQPQAPENPCSAREGSQPRRVGPRCDQNQGTPPASGTSTRPYELRALHVLLERASPDTVRGRAGCPGRSQAGGGGELTYGSVWG